MVPEVLRSKIANVIQRSPTLSVAVTLAESARGRSVEVVRDVYAEEWGRYRAWLAGASTVEAWLRIPGVEDKAETVNVDGALVHQPFDHRTFVLDELTSAMRDFFPGVTSATEFGSGVGRNCVGLKARCPDMRVQGYELTPEGVSIARASAEKFGLDVPFAQLDYVSSPESSYVHPKSDVGFTVYSLHEVPGNGARAVANMLAHVERGLVLLEPAPEAFPLTYRGALGRVYARARGYLHGLDRDVDRVSARRVHRRRLATSNNPVFFPTLYVLEK